jgi:hypothetical protein
MAIGSVFGLGLGVLGTILTVFIGPFWECVVFLLIIAGTLQAVGRMIPVKTFMESIIAGLLVAFFTLIVSIYIRILGLVILTPTGQIGISALEFVNSINDFLRAYGILASTEIIERVNVFFGQLTALICLGVPMFGLCCGAPLGFIGGATAWRIYSRTMITPRSNNRDGPKPPVNRSIIGRRGQH